MARLLAVALLVVGMSCCAPASRHDTAAARGAAPPPDRLSATETAFLDTLERRTFAWFWDLSDPRTGLTPDRWPTRSFCSIAAVGFALTAYPIGVERHYVTRATAAERVLTTLRFFWNARQDSAAHGATGYRGFFYHFLDPRTGTRFQDVELSTQDTALLLAGVLFTQSYFDRSDPREGEIRAMAESLYDRVDWNWATVRPPSVVLGWTPEQGPTPEDWGGYNETMILQVLALGSPTHPADDGLWAHFVKTYAWGRDHGQEYIGFAPLFGHQYSHVWIDFRGIQDPYMRGKGIDYFENSRRATLAQRGYAIENPSGFRGYGERLWGLTACDGPFDGVLVLDGRERHFMTYAARGTSFTETRDDGTVAPCAAGGSLPFAPEVTLPVLMAMRADYGDTLFGRYGFMDALCPTLSGPARVQAGRVVPGLGWFDTDQLGIDQGPILAMAENLRSGLVWRVMRTNPHVVRGLRRAGFEGGWLAGSRTR
ncbi:MAG: glucoamylase family protein [Candidatus Eisenbacteria bacterium]